MKSIQNKTLGFTLALLVADSVEEYDKLAGRVGATLDDANRFTVFHGWNSEFRSAFVEALEKETGIARPINQEATDKQPAKKDGTKTPVYVNEKKYTDMVLAQTGKKITDFKDLADSVAAKIPFDPSEGTRGGGKVAKEFLEAADSIISKGDEAVEWAVGNLQSLNPGLPIDLGETEDERREGLARAIKVNQQRKLRELENELLG